MEITFVNTAKALKEKQQEYTEKGYKCISCWSGCNCNPDSLHRIIRDFPRKSAVSIENEKGEKIRFVLCKDCTGGNVKAELKAQKEYQKLSTERTRIEARMNYLGSQFENLNPFKKGLNHL